eukprot:COSAG01_NODE_37632_length_500_cov_80.182045_1_plen_42_part_01
MEDMCHDHLFTDSIIVRQHTIVTVGGQIFIVSQSVLKLCHGL